MNNSNLIQNDLNKNNTKNILNLKDLEIKLNPDLDTIDKGLINWPSHYIDSWMINKEPINITHRLGDCILPSYSLITDWGKCTYSTIVKGLGRLYDVKWDFNLEKGKLDKIFYYPLLDQRWFQHKILKGQPPFLYKKCMSAFGQALVLTNLTNTGWNSTDITDGSREFYTRNNGHISFVECKIAEPYFDPETLWFCKWCIHEKLHGFMHLTI